MDVQWIDGQPHCLASVKGPSGMVLDRLFLVDTGASFSLIPLQEARALGLPLVRRVPVATAAGYQKDVPVVSAGVDVDGCGFFETEFYAMGVVYALGMPVISRCGLNVSPAV